MKRRTQMKMYSTILAAALVAGSCTVAMAQAGGGGAAGGDQSQQGTMKDADKNPTGPGANPTAGNTASPTAGQGGQSGMSGAPQGGMMTAPAANTRSDSPNKPAGTKDATGAGSGAGGSK
jgi:hypothetical protein